MTNRQQSPDWTFLSNHTHVLHCIYLWPEIRIRDIAVKVEITERAVQRIVVDLERGGYLTRERVGRQNHYRLEPHVRLRHPLEHHVEVGRLLTALQPKANALESAVGKSQAFSMTVVRGSKSSPVEVAKGKSRSKRPLGRSPKRVAKKSV